METKVLLTVKEFSQFAGLGERKVREISHIQGFPAIRIGKKIMIHRERAVEWLGDFAVSQSEGSCKSLL